VRTAADHVNNMEQVLVDTPVPGIWSVEVRGFDLPSGPQSFSLVSSHPLTAEPHLSFSFPNGLPAALPPGVAMPVTARIVGVNDSVIGGTPTLHVRHGDGAFLDFPMSALGGDLYQAELPPTVCSDTPEFYFSATGLASGLATSPAGAPGEVYPAFVATLSTVFSDGFNFNNGWTVSSVVPFAGAWQRATPAGGGINGDPLTAWGGGGLCFVTGNNVNADLDGGPTRLLSPLFDLSAGGSFEVSYARWFTNNAGDGDTLLVQLSNDDGVTFTTVEVVTAGGGGGWVRSSFRVEDFLTPTNQVRVRFRASDPVESHVEAAIDDFRIVRSECARPTRVRRRP
jgi:hypothetical protein